MFNEPEVVGLNLLPIRKRRLVDVENQGQLFALGGAYLGALGQGRDCFVDHATEIALIGPRTLIIDKLTLESSQIAWLPFLNCRQIRRPRAIRADHTRRSTSKEHQN